MQKSLEYYIEKHGKAFVSDMFDIIRIYLTANNIRLPSERKPKDPRVIKVIAEVTSEVLGVPIKDIYSKSHKKPCVVARNIISDIAYSEYLFTYKAIGAELGRECSTIIRNLVTHNLDMEKLPNIKYIRSRIVSEVGDILRDLQGEMNDDTVCY